MNLLRRLQLDPFTLALLAVVALAIIAPVTGAAARGMDLFTDLAIAALFFMHGAKLSRAAVKEGTLHYRLHLTILSATFVLFPLLALGARPLFGALLDQELALGFLFLAALPSTVQSSIAFTSMARGNVPAAVVAASISSLLGVFFTPALMPILIGAGLGEGAPGSATGGDPLAAVTKLSLQLLAPFILGHSLRPIIGDFVDRNRGIIRYTDQGTILLIVYTAFSASIVGGFFSDTSLVMLLMVGALSALLLAVAMSLITFGSRRLGFAREDEIAIVFAGSKKSLATGVPMAKVMFESASLGPILLPVMIYHQIQLMVCAVVAQRYARRESTELAQPSP